MLQRCGPFFAVLVIAIMLRPQSHAQSAPEAVHETSGFITQILSHDTPGTSAKPDSVSEPTFMQSLSHGWMFMFHGVAFLNLQQQCGPRGGDELFSPNWSMPMFQRPVGRGQLTLRTMVSFEPATVTDRCYPELFQQGETAF